ncbi:hypothetical protein [Microvirga sp. TS319]|jgi:hypothetical protein|uniref:hypothetical protein n=1 Tax=Microvirga sp. TS319 TaxID=3241165 RepID=UPI00351A9294
MARLNPVARRALKRKAFRKPIADYLARVVEWDHSALKPVKDLVRIFLRLEQDEICPYCQRLIIPERRNMTEHIEHYLDKSHAEYRKFGFTATNLVLACIGCNMTKTTRDLVVDGKAKPIHLTIAEAPFRWPHPYFDDITESLHKAPGPVYSAIPGSLRQAETEQMITDLKLDTLENAESHHGRLLAEQNRLWEEVNALMKQMTPENMAKLEPLHARLQRISRELN